MKTNLLKYYLVASCLCSDFVMLAQQPGSDDNNGGLEDVDPVAPIDDYILVLAAIGLIYVFWKLKVFYGQENKII